MTGRNKTPDLKNKRSSNEPSNVDVIRAPFRQYGTQQNSLDIFYVAVPGNTPTKITFKRHKPSLSSSLSKANEFTLFTPTAIVQSSITSNTTVSLTDPNSEDNAEGNVCSSSVAKSYTNDDVKIKTSDLSNKRSLGQDNIGNLLVTNETKKPRLNLLSVPSISRIQQLLQKQQKLMQQQKALSRQNILSWKSVHVLQKMRHCNTKFKRETTSLPATPFTLPTTTAEIPMPPNWHDNYEDAIMSIDTFQKYDVEPSTQHFQTLESMLHPLQVKSVSQIVNPDLWKRFINTRKEMLRSKSSDPNILTQLDLDERDVLRYTNLALSQAKDSSSLPPYSDNMALLFHCTKNKSNLNSILSQGLDERLSNVFGGRLGKGIYFADNPQKSLQYDLTGRILVFAVLLGDCISVDHFPFKNALVREPEKNTREMRNPRDIFYDSIIGRPAGYNEYVIYNRYQCCPLYEISYDSQVVGKHILNHFNNATDELPPFIWLPDNSNCAIRMKNVCEKWPFYAKDLFRTMATSPPSSIECIDNLPQSVEANTEEISLMLGTLPTFKFVDLERSNDMLELDSIPGVALGREDETKNETNPEKDVCLICCTEYTTIMITPGLWKELKCGHKLCLACYHNLLTTRITMSRVKHTFIRCPFCSDVTGTNGAVGTCPDIRMIIRMIPNSCEGYESTNTISIQYFADSEYKLNRTAYLPNTQEGREVLMLLEKACDRRFCFKVGDSLTTGRKNVLVWAIHHKTSMRGGVTSYGYPDPGYFDRVKSELKSYGIQ